ncbi:hypothetical protein SDC9_160525 [bioreactor metagenome]|uniref:Uncharacterized protein n=1 Tax=bioreactor metagenome TaxID=1076179 RepID=A0A645FFM5_9ZZZZ
MLADAQVQTSVINPLGQPVPVLQQRVMADRQLVALDAQQPSLQELLRNRSLRLRQ